MKLSWFRFLDTWNFEGHEAWLSEQARKGLHYRSRVMGFDRFEPGEPGEFVFCWDCAPLWGKEQKVTYVRTRVQAGWQPVAETGNLVCWCSAVVAGQPPRIMRDAEETVQMLKRIRTDYLVYGSFLAFLTVRAITKLMTDNPSFRVGHWFGATVGTLGLAMLAYALVRLKERT
ncbi:DUF2812 domain-containing protein [Pseudoduganella sp. OTU4001]|uniref:DUF2812 domain-containing protein n=1 Tax=Pseudoduganella sp. OTU4001 TaxID=3043854 RepID=UPI00313D4DB5